VKPRIYGSFLNAGFTATITAAVVTGGLLFLPLKPLAGQDAAKAGGKDTTKAGAAAKGGAGRGGAKGGGFQVPEGPTPRKADGKVDFSGYWARPYTPDMSLYATDMSGKPFANEDRNARGQVAPPPPPPDPNAPGGGRGGRGGGGGGSPRVLPYTAWGANDWKNYSPDNGDYTGACLPFGLMRSINSPDPLQVMQDGPFMAYLFEQNTWFHLFPIDGRPHSKDNTPTWFGDSVGHFEGDTLVIQTVNFNGKTRLDTNGHPHSDQLVLTEKWTRPDLGHVIYEMDIHDPKTYTQDWKIIDDSATRQFILHNEQHIMEYSCEENNKALYEGRIKAPKYNDN
jgi:hypothetical protein